MGAGSVLDVTYDKNSESKNHNDIKVYRQLIDLQIDTNPLLLQSFKAVTTQLALRSMIMVKYAK